MKIKMVSYYTGNLSQIFATFEYQKVKFDMFKNLEEIYPQWKFLEDTGFSRLSKIANIEQIEKNCISHLISLDSLLF